MALMFPKINQFRFYSMSDVTSSSNVNFPNHDGITSWQGVNSKCWIQPIPRAHYDSTNGLNFFIRTSSPHLSGLTVYIKKSDGTSPVTLTPTLFYTYASSDRVYTFSHNISAFADGYYYVSIDSPSGEQYRTDTFEIKMGNQFGECYPAIIHNFENDFGVIWTNTTPTDWKLRLLIPFRMYRPLPKLEKNVYQNDGGTMTTLRSVIQRGIEIETMPVSLWFGEMLQMIAACSSIVINKVSVNFEEMPTLQLIEGTDLCTVTGVAYLTTFNDKYLIDVS